MLSIDLSIISQNKYYVYYLTIHVVYSILQTYTGLPTYTNKRVCLLLRFYTKNRQIFKISNGGHFLIFSKDY